MLWFDNQAEEAAKFYCSIFKHSKILGNEKYTEAGHDITGGKPGSVMVVEFEIEGQHFTALNGGPIFKFNEAVSFIIDCKSQEEVDYYWEKLSAVPASEQCGWLKDKFGVSWQVVPDILTKLVSDKDRVKADRTTVAMLKMKKLDIQALQDAHDGK